MAQHEYPFAGAAFSEITCAHRRAIHVVRLSCLCALLSILACNSSSKPNDQEGEAAAVPVTTTKVAAKTLTRAVSTIGTLESPDAVEIKPEVNALVKHVRFDDGATVATGDVLYDLDDAELREQLRASRGALDEARAREANAKWNFNRIEQLAEADSARVEELKNARDEFHRTQAAVRRLTAEVEAAAERLKNATILAPASGTMSASIVEPGDYVEAAQKIATLYANGPLEVTFAIPERHAARITVGTSMTFRVPEHPKSAFEARITYIDPAVDPDTRTLTCKALVDDQQKRLRPGSFADVRVGLELRENVPVIPEEALVRTRDASVVYVVEKSKANRREVEPGLREAGLVEVLRGVQSGETIVRTGHMRLRDGALVEVISSDDEPAPAPPARSRDAGTD